MIEITAIDTSLQGQGEEIIKATMSGLLAPDIGEMLINALSSQGKLVEISEIAQRLEALENAKH